MTEIITEKTLEEFEAFNQSHPKGNFAQSSYWAKQKPMWTWRAVACRDAEGNIRGTISALIRKLPGLPYSMMYCCRGPVCDVHDAETFHELMTALRELARQYRCYVIKIDPDVPSSDEEFAQILKKEGFRSKDSGAAFEAIQPRYVFRLNIEGKTTDELLASFHQKTRYNIRLAGRKGVQVRICGKEMIPAFSELMLVTGVRDGFVTRQPEYFAAMLDNLGEHCRLYMAFYEDEPIAGTLAIWYGDKVWYLYGASSNAHRNLMPNYLLQWEMIQWAVEKGCRIYDFRGVPGLVGEDHPLYGLVKFKRGFNGDYTEFIGELDLVLKPMIYHTVEKGTAVFKELRRRVYLLRHRDKAPTKKKGEPASGQN